MAVYDGFFDAVADEETGEFDRSYSSGSFTDYFAHIIGSGVCIHNNQDSFKVRFEGGNAVVSPGYLFIQGYWLKNDADYTVPVTGDATLAIVAHLNMGNRMIEIETVSVAQAYPDSLVLGLVNPAAGTAEDTRNNTDICGVIDTAGELSKKVEWALNYIDNEVESRLTGIENDIAEKSAENDAKIAAAKTEADNKISALSGNVDNQIAAIQAQVDKISPPPIGTIKFSASQNIEPGWLLCDGDFISESQYPELVAALGKLTPGASEFSEKANGSIPMDISNGVLHDGFFWVFSFTDKKLHGIPAAGGTAKEITVTGADLLKSPRTYPIYLTIVDSELFIAQQQSSLIYSGLVVYLNYSFDNTASSVTVEKLEITKPDKSYSVLVPPACYVIKETYESGTVWYRMAAGHVKESDSAYISSNIRWKNDNEVNLSSYTIFQRTSTRTDLSRFTAALAIPAFSKKNSGEFPFSYLHERSISSIGATTYKSEVSARSAPNGLIKGIYGEYEPSRNNVYKTISLSDFSSILLIKYNVGNGQIGLYLQSITSAQYITVNVSLPTMGPRASAFTDAALYMKEQGLWMFFVGTGIVFTNSITDSSAYGFLDTTEVLGVITQFGYMEHDPANNLLYISGQDSENVVKVATLKIPALYDYANDGAWLPMIASDGVPAYIKAKEAQ